MGGPAGEPPKPSNLQPRIEPPSPSASTAPVLGKVAKWGCGLGLGVVTFLLIALVLGSAKREGRATKAEPPATVAATTVAAQSAADAYGERIKTYWLPEARSLPSELPADEAQIGALLTKIDGLVVNVRDGSPLALSKDQKQDRSQFVSVLTARQRALLPAMREQYGSALDARLFRRDIRVTTSGSRSTVLRFTGAIFSLNANVEDMQTEIRPTVRQLRFAKVEFRWSPYFQNGLRYDLDPPSDAELGQWNGDSFEKVASATVSNTPASRCVPKLAKQVGLTC